MYSQNPATECPVKFTSDVWILIVAKLKLVSNELMILCRYCQLSAVTV